MSIEELKFFLSTEQDCSYLDGIQSASIFADPDTIMTTEAYSILINHGFRRSADYVYRPHCPTCSSCKPTRIPVDQFKPNRNQKRVWKRNSDITIHPVSAEFKTSHFELYKKYISHRHAGGEMDNTNEARYIEFLRSDWCDTIFFEFKLKDQLIGVAVTDKLKDGLSALYTFFDPALASRSLGTLGVLWQIEKAKEMQKPFVYLGYWIKESNKMNYKQNFSPLEIWDNEQWRLLNKDCS